MAPSMREVPLAENPEAFSFFRRLRAGEFDLVILLTGVGTRALDKVGFGMPGLTNTQARELIEALSTIREQAGDAEPSGEGRASRVS